MSKHMWVADNLRWCKFKQILHQILRGCVAEKILGGQKKGGRILRVDSSVAAPSIKSKHNRRWRKSHAKFGVHNAAVEWLDPHRNVLSRLLFILFLLLFFSGDFDRFRAWLPHFAPVYWMGKAGWRGRFQCRPLLYPMCDVHLLHHLRSRYNSREGGQLMDVVPFFLLPFFIILLQLLFLFFSRWPEPAVNRWLLDIVYGHHTVPRGPFVFSTPVQ